MATVMPARHDQGRHRHGYIGLQARSSL